MVRDAAAPVLRGLPGRGRRSIVPTDLPNLLWKRSLRHSRWQPPSIAEITAGIDLGGIIQRNWQMTTVLSKSVTRKTSSSERLIAAALVMFSRRGMAATTREIAEEAGVNEVTLFRL